jgi:DNA-binding transcriptional regulator GbsR (MarR family)
MATSGLDTAENLFIGRWGEMGASWGISRTMAEIHALLYLSREPLCTDDVMTRLEVSRGNVSMNLRQLVNWGLIHRVHHRGDRKEYFEAEREVWQMFETITRERRRREVEPIIETIERCRAIILRRQTKTTGDDAARSDALMKRFDDMLDFFAVMNSMFHLMIQAGPTGMRRLASQLAPPAARTSASA